MKYLLSAHIQVLALAMLPALACGPSSDDCRSGECERNDPNGVIIPECPWEELSPTAKWDNMTDFSRTSKQVLIASIANGRMSSLDGRSCELVPPVTTAWAPCEDHYRCGGCVMFVRRNSEGTWIMSMASPDDGTCDHVDAIYFGTRSSGGGGGGNDCNYSECLLTCAQAGGTYCGEVCKC